MKTQKRLLTFGIFIFLFSIFYFYDVRAVSVYDGYSCVNGALKRDSDGAIVGKCSMIEGTTKFETCPTQEQKNKYSLNKISSDIEFEYDSANDWYNMVIGNLKGLYAQATYGKNLTPSVNMYPDSNGKVRINGLPLDMQITIQIYLDSSNGTCSGTKIGTLTRYTPSYRSNVLYNDTLCVQYRSKFAHKQSLAQSFVPECYVKNTQFQYNRDDIKLRIDEATTSIINLSKSDAAANIDLLCDFYGQNNKGGGESAEHRYVVNKYWDVICFETLDVSFDTPKALYAGDSFEYWVDVKITKVCYPVWKKDKFPEDPGDDVECEDEPGTDPNNPNPGDGDPGQHFPSSCEFVTVCNVKNSDNEYISTNHAGPNDTFDSCVQDCDGGKYTQSCINKCYSNIYASSSSAFSNSKMSTATLAVNKQLLSAKKISRENMSSSSGVPFYKEIINGEVHYTTGQHSTGWDGLVCRDVKYIDTDGNGTIDKFELLPEGASSDVETGCHEYQIVNGSKKAVKVDDSRCDYRPHAEILYSTDANPFWIPLTKYCYGTNSKGQGAHIADTCGDTYCYEEVKNPSCLEGSGLLDGSSSSGASAGVGSGINGGVFGSTTSGPGGSSTNKSTKNCKKPSAKESCSGKGTRILDELQKSLDEVYAKLERGEYVNYDDGKTQFEGTIIDSLTNEKLVYKNSNGNPLNVGDTSIKLGVIGTEYEKITYEWKCFDGCKSCPKKDKDDGGSGGGGGGGHMCGPSCYGGPGFASSSIDGFSATQMSSNGIVKKVSDDEDDSESCDCGKEYKDYKESRNFVIKKYSTKKTFTINLGNAYKSAVNSTTVYGDETYQKLPASTKPYFYYAGDKYFSDLFSPVINDWRKWPTYGPNQIKPNCLADKSCINSRDPSIKHNIIEYFVVGSWGQWKVNILCFYGIINNYCPDCPDVGDEGTPRVPCDPKTEVCTGLQYIFRPIDLDNKNMFPERNPRWNWTGTIDTNLNTGSINVTGAAKNTYNYKVDPQKLINAIQNKGSSIYSTSNAATGKDSNPELDYEIVLSKANIRTIKNDTNHNAWNTCTGGRCVKNSFDMNCSKVGGDSRIVCTSKFLREPKYLQLVKSPSENGCNNLYAGRCIDSGSK